MSVAGKLVLIILNALILVECKTPSENKSEIQNPYLWLPSYLIFEEAVKYSSKQNECSSCIKQIVDGLSQREMWAIKVLDASGFPSGRFVQGSVFWHGSPKMCNSLNYESQYVVSDAIKNPAMTAMSPFRVKYITLIANSTTEYRYNNFLHVWRPIQIGICVPEICDSQDIIDLAQNVFSKKLLPYQHQYDVSLNVVDAKQSSVKAFIFRRDTFVILSIIFLFISFVLWINFVYKEQDSNILSRVKQCFDLRTNYNDLMKCEAPPNAIISVDGLKSIACLLNCVIHTALIGASFYKTSSDFALFVMDFRFSPIFLAIYFTDSFFVISAFLFTYNFLKNEKQKQMIMENGFMANVKYFFKLYLHRYLRIAPSFILCIVLGRVIVAYLQEVAMMYVGDELELTCQISYWWRHFLFIHSFFPNVEMCVGWGWYLSNDMVYFTFTLVGLFLFLKYQSLMKCVFVVTTIFFVGNSFVQNIIHDYSIRIDRFIDTMDTVYMPPTIRANPYFVGIFGGYILYTYKDQCRNFSKLMISAWKTTSIGYLLILLVCSQFPNSVPYIVMQYGNSIGRFMFGGIVMWTILVFNSNYDGRLKNILSHRIFVHLGKLLYMIYLLSPLMGFVYRSFNETIEMPLIMSNIYVDSLALSLLTYIISIPATLIFEVPFCRLSKEFVMKRSLNKDKVK